MAEPGAPILDNRRLMMIVGAVVAVILLFFLWSFRGCIVSPIAQGDGYVKIFTNLDLKDAANVVARLKDLKIAYKLSQNGSVVSVPKEKADDARLGLAEKNLPQGGMVGWEIFNETRMGATDFDRRIQLIRAISGELARMIMRIDGIEDTRVQIVLPETKLFEVTKAPVTAAVLLKITPGKRLSYERINGIINLVASSVENLKPENVTIVDDSGNILSKMTAEQIASEPNGPQQAPPQTIVKSTAEAIVEQQVMKKEAAIPAPAAPATKEIAAPQKEKAQIQLTDEEKAMLRLKAKEEFEKQLTSKTQELLNQFYPANTIITRVNVSFSEPKKNAKATKLKIYTDSGYVFADIKNIAVIILVDNKIKLSQKLKNSTYQTAALAVSYDKKRGDKIILKQVPFHYATQVPKNTKQKPLMPEGKLPNLNYLIWGLSGLAAIALIVFAVLSMRPKQKGLPFEAPAERMPEEAPSESMANETVKQIKDMAQGNPERLANLLKKWLTEETQ